MIGALTLILTAPLFLFGGFIMVFFYHVDTIDIASPWFSLLPKLFFGSGFNNLFCATTLTSFRLLPASLVKRGLFLLLMLFLFTSCLISGISTYGCFELQSIILQVCSCSYAHVLIYAQTYLTFISISMNKVSDKFSFAYIFSPISTI